MYYCKFENFDHKSRQAYVMLSIYAVYKIHMLIVYSSMLAMTCKMRVRLVSESNTSNILIKYKYIKFIQMTSVMEFLSTRPRKTRWTFLTTGYKQLVNVDN